MPPHFPLSRLTTLALLLAVLGVGSLGASGGGCATTQSNNNLESPQDLQMRVESFHRYLRWEMFEKAAGTVHEAHRETFLGRYEEYGDDLDIVSVEMRRIDRDDSPGEETQKSGRGSGPKTGQRVRVEVEQRWYVEPDMRVKEKRFVEIWELTGQGWMLRERMRREEWRRRQKEEDSVNRKP